MANIRICIALLIITLISCNKKTSTQNNINKLHYYLGIGLPQISNLQVFEYCRMEGYNYPKSIYISFTCKNPQEIINQLKLIPSKPFLNKDTSRKDDYKYAKSTYNFWKLSSTITSADIINIERKKLSWWRPSNDTTKVNFGGFYNQFGIKKIVNSKGRNWTGRLIFQNIGSRVYIQIDILVGKNGDWREG